MQRSEALWNIRTGVKRLFAYVGDGDLKRVLRATPRPPSTGRRPLPRLDLDAAAQDYAQGSTVREIATRQSVHRNSVATALRRAGLTLRMDSLTNDEIETVAALHEQGLSLNEIGRRVGRDPKTVKSALGKRV